MKEGDAVRKGQLLMEFDLAEIAKKYPTVTPVLVANTDDYASVEGVSGMEADQNTVIIKVK